MRVLIAGSSGFLGTRLVRHLRDGGHQVVRLVRREPRTGDEIRWNPAGGVLDPSVLSNVDVAVNLAGAGIGDRRWSSAYKKRIRDSRVDSTTTLSRGIASALGTGAGPKVLLNASAVGYYGDAGDRPVTEESPGGEGFLAEVCRVWEFATGPAEDAGARVVHLRTGLVLARGAGLLKGLLLPFRLGAGGKLGNGRQYVPWISTDDWLGATTFLLDVGIAGPVNVVGPEPVTNAELTRALARLVHRPAIAPLPVAALRLIVGEFAGEVVASQRVLPGVLTAAGYRFRHRDVTAALRAALDER